MSETALECRQTVLVGMQDLVATTLDVEQLHHYAGMQLVNSRKLTFDIRIYQSLSLNDESCLVCYLWLQVLQSSLCH